MILRRVSVLLLTAVIGSFSASAAPTESSVPNFTAFREQLWPDAQARGITRATFDAAFADVAPDPRVIAATKRQPEYGKPVGTYIASLASPANIAVGRRKAAQWADTLAAAEKKFGVDRWIILAIWGVESSYGAEKDRWDVIRSLATLAQARYREPYFRNELLAALQILQAGHIARNRMLGSWAGAMGQTQFMPSNFIDYAIDFSGDGRPDIWTNIADVLGSTAHYLAKGGWKPGVTWGYEVTVPKDFDYRKSHASFSEWSKLGVRRADGGVFPAAGEGILFFPSGAAGPAFVATENYDVLKEYNNSDAYVLAVGHLADRMRGLGPLRTAWPADDRQMSRDERIALQRKLAELGYDVKEFEGHIDFALRDSIRDVQLKFGMIPDGHPTSALLDSLRSKPP